MSSISLPATVFLVCYLSCTRNLTKPHYFGRKTKIFPGATAPGPLPSTDTTQTPPPATPLQPPQLQGDDPQRCRRPLRWSSESLSSDDPEVHLRQQLDGRGQRFQPHSHQESLGAFGRVWRGHSQIRHRSVRLFPTWQGRKETQGCQKGRRQAQEGCGEEVTRQEVTGQEVASQDQEVDCGKESSGRGKEIHDVCPKACHEENRSEEDLRVCIQENCCQENDQKSDQVSSCFSTSGAHFAQSRLRSLPGKSQSNRLFSKPQQIPEGCPDVLPGLTFFILFLWRLCALDDVCTASARSSIFMFHFFYGIAPLLWVRISFVGKKKVKVSYVTSVAKQAKTAFFGRRCESRRSSGSSPPSFAPKGFFFPNDNLDRSKRLDLKRKRLASSLPEQSEDTFFCFCL